MEYLRRSYAIQAFSYRRDYLYPIIFIYIRTKGLHTTVCRVALGNPGPSSGRTDVILTVFRRRDFIFGKISFPRLENVIQ